MKVIKSILKIALVFLTFGALASLFLNKNKDDYIPINQNDLDLY